MVQTKLGQVHMVGNLFTTQYIVWIGCKERDQEVYVKLTMMSPLKMKFM